MGRKQGYSIRQIILVCITVSFVIISGFNFIIIGLSESTTHHSNSTNITRASDEIKLNKDWHNYIGTVNDLAWGDMDMDGYLDLAIALYNDNVQVYKNINGTLGNTPYWKSGSPYTATCIAWGDLDSDGYLELAVGGGIDYDKPKNTTRKLNLVFKNFDGMLGATPYWFSNDRRNTTDLLWADIDKDNDMDLVASNYGENGENVIYQNKDNTLRPIPWWVSDDTFWTEAIACGDIDNDGDLDLVAGNNRGEQNLIYFNNNNNLEKVASWVSQDSVSVLDIALGDVDSDGDLDIVAGTSDSNMCVIYYNKDGMYELFFDWSLTGNYECHSIALGDVDSDGDLDLALGCKNNGNKENNFIYPNIDDSFDSKSSWQSQDNSKTTAVALADFDNDGDLDFSSVSNGSIEESLIYENTADKLPFALTLLPTNHGYGTVVTPKGVSKGIIRFNFTLYDKESDPVRAEAQYSIDQSSWKSAAQWTGTSVLDLTNLATSPGGKKYSFYWDTSKINKESNSVIFKIKIHEKSSKLGLYQYSTTTVSTKYFGYGEAPSTPTGLSHGKITTNSVNLYWTDNPLDEFITGYEVYVNETNSTSEYKLIRNEKKNITYTVKDLTENTSYYFRILAYDSVGFKSELSQRISCRTFNKPPEVKATWTPSKIIITEDKYNNGSLNLYEVFFDPTGDPLKFSVKHPNNFTTKILKNGDVNFKPNKDWFGTESLMFMADDGQGQYHQSGGPAMSYIMQEISVEPVNDPPELIWSMGAIQITEDPVNATRLNLLNYFHDNDPNEQLKFRIEGLKNVTIEITPSGYAEIMPKQNWHGTELIIIYASDKQKEIYDFLSIIVNPVNDAPVIKTSNLYWESGQWQNQTLDIRDPDELDVLIISTNLEDVLPGLVKGENYLFDLQTGNLSVFVTKDMIGYYKFILNVTDGTTTVQKQITLSVVLGTDIENGGKASDKEEDYFLIIIIVIIIIIIISILIVFQWHKKSQKISFIKCSNCNQSVVRKGKGAFRCEHCGTTIEPSTDDSRVVVPTVTISTARPHSPPVRTTTLQSGPEVATVSGGIYPKSILEGSVLDKPLTEEYVTEPPEPEPVPEPPPQPASLPMAIPISQAPPQQPQPMQVQPQQQHASYTPVPVPRPVPRPRTTTIPQPSPPQALAPQVKPIQQQPLTMPPRAIEEEDAE